MPYCVVLGVTGGIAAYKAADLVSRLVKRGADVRVIMTEHACRFVAPLTFETLSHNPVVRDMFDRRAPWEVEHISLAKRADVFCIAPASANLLGKAAAGIADDMLTTTLLATRAPVLAAPAMNTNMYENPVVQRNMETLRTLGWTFVEPGEGRLACGDVGRGKLAEVPAIEAAIWGLLQPRQDLKGLRVLVTAGPTREAVDPVRYLTNRSSGRMGYAIAEAAARRGAAVTLISGPVALPCPAGVERLPVQSTRQMHEACTEAWTGCDLAVMAAAPSDYRPASPAEQKLKRGAGGLTLELVENEDIAAALGRAKRPNQVLVAFAAETQDLIVHARGKMERKNADMIVANDVTKPGAGFDVETNVATLLFRDGGSVSCPMMRKAELADRILDEALRLRGV